MQQFTCSHLVVSRENLTLRTAHCPHLSGIFPLSLLLAFSVADMLCSDLNDGSAIQFPTRYQLPPFADENAEFAPPRQIYLPEAKKIAGSLHVAGSCRLKLSGMILRPQTSLGHEPQPLLDFLDVIHVTFDPQHHLLAGLLA